jgi:hypothetical protein
MDKNEVLFLLLFGAILGIGSLILLIDLLPIISVVGLGFLLWHILKYTSNEEKHNAVLD